MKRLLLLLALSAMPAFAQDPQVTVTLDPDGPVTVGTPLTVTVTLLVPTYMPEPPIWPDMQIADAITQMPDRATSNVTQRIDRQSWAGIKRIWTLTPQRAADYDMGDLSIDVTYVGPDNTPVEISAPIPAIAFTAVLPPGAEGMDPFIAATALSVTMDVTGLTDTPKTGDAITVTLTTTASGTTAMLLPPLTGQLPDQPGLRAYPAQPTVADGDSGAQRIDTITYMIEQPGNYAFPGISLDWWNSTTSAVETAAADGVTFAVAGAPVTGTGGDGAQSSVIPGLLVALVGIIALLLLPKHDGPRPITERAAYRQLRQVIRSGRADQIRPALSVWLESLSEKPDAKAAAQIDDALVAVERGFYGPSLTSGADSSARQRLGQAVHGARQRHAPRQHGALPDLNPTIG